MFKKIANAVLVNDLLDNFLFDAGQIDLTSLQGVVHFLGDGEEISRALDHAPFSAKAETIHEQGERGNHLGHAAAVISRIEIHHAQTLELPCLLANAFHVFASDERLVIFDLRDAVTRHS